MEKSLEERYGNEILTDNSVIENCKQCKDCAFKDDGTPYSNYQKCCCMIYEDPEMKPLEVIDNTGTCELYEKEE